MSEIQTFLPYADFAECARVLDRLRLGKQRVETYQIMQSLLIPDYGWKDHTAVRMWRGYEFALMDYQRATCHEWTEVRGYKDTCLIKTDRVLQDNLMTREDWSEHCEDPPWLGREDLHLSHRSRLIQKDRGHYEPQFPDTPDDLEYVWPV